MVGEHFRWTHCNKHYSNSTIETCNTEALSPVVKLRQNMALLNSSSCHFELFEFFHLHLVELLSSSTTTYEI